MHYRDDMHIYSNANWLLRSVQRIVVPVTLSVNVGFRWELFVNLNVLRHPIFIWLKLYFNIQDLIFYVCEGLSQPIAKCKKIMVSIYLTMKATIFDTHATNAMSSNLQRIVVNAFVKS